MVAITNNEGDQPKVGMCYRK